MAKMFDICTVQMDYNYSEQGGVRPAIIIQNDVGNAHSNTVIILPLTGQSKKTNQPTHCTLFPTKTNGLSKQSIVLGEQVRCVGKQRIINKIGTVDLYDRNKVISAYLANVTGKRDNKVS